MKSKMRDKRKVSNMEDEINDLYFSQNRTVDEDSVIGILSSMRSYAKAEDAAFGLVSGLLNYQNSSNRNRDSNSNSNTDLSNNIHDSYHSYNSYNSNRRNSTSCPSSVTSSPLKRPRSYFEEDNMNDAIAVKSEEMDVDLHFQRTFKLLRQQSGSNDNK
eukprot:Pgem_evm1s9968